MNTVTIECIFNKLYPRVDRSVTLGFQTKEINSDSMKELYEHLHSYVAIAIVPINKEVTDIYKIDGLRLTKSQELRRELLANWKIAGEPGAFEEFYNDEMDKIIKSVSPQKELALDSLKEERI